MVPLGSADRAEDDRVGRLAFLHHPVGHGVLVLVDRRAAGDFGGEIEAESAGLGDAFKDADRLFGDIGTDAVTRKKDD